MFKFSLLLVGSTLAESCLQCSSIKSSEDQTKVPTAPLSFGAKGENCFNPYDTDGSFDQKLAGMVKSCTGGGNLGCYSLAYAVKRKHTRPENTFDNIVDYYIERGCQNDMPKYFPTATSKDIWGDVTLNELNFGIKSSLTAKMTSRTAITSTSTENTKLNFPTAENGGVISPGGQSFDYLTCFKENRMETFKTKTLFRSPTKKVRCGLHENRCFSSVAHVRKNSDTYIQFAYRGCTNQNATLLNPAEKPYYVKSKLQTPYQDLNVTHIIEFCKTGDCNNKVQAYTTGSTTILHSSLLLTLLMLLLN